MAIVKANYTRARAEIKANLRYITHRPDSDGKKQTRQLFGWFGELTKEEAYRMIAEAQKGTIGFRIVLNFDPKRENANKDLDLRDLTIQFMIKLRELKERDFVFFAVEHNDHTDLPHVHAIVLFRGRITKQDLNILRYSLTKSVSIHRAIQDGIHMSLGRESTKTRSTEQRFINRQATSSRPIGMAGGKARDYAPPPLCPKDSQVMKRMRHGYRCPECGRKQELGISL